MIVIGGRGKNIQELMPTEVYDTESSEWKRFSSVGLFRHNAFIKESIIYVYGGFENSNPNNPVEKLSKIDIMQYFKSSTYLTGKIEAILDTKKENKVLTMHSVMAPNNNLSQGLTQIDLSRGAKTVIESNVKEEKKFFISNTAIVLKSADENAQFDINSLITKVSIDKLNEEAKRIGFSNVRSQIPNKRVFNEQVVNKFIETLMKPFDWFNPEMKDIHDSLPFSGEEIDILLTESLKILSKEPSLMKVKSPVKIFGSLYGQYNDLMRYFESFGNPSDENTMGDIHLFQYYLN